MLIVAFLKLVPGVFGLFLHYGSGKYSKFKVDDLSIFFIIGFETLIALMFILFNFLFCALSFTKINLENPILIWIIIGILVALSVAYFCFYYQKGPGTKLFISRTIAQNFDKKAQTVKSRSDAFALGFTAGIPELLFTIPLYFISTIEISKLCLSDIPCCALIIIFIILSAVPLFIQHAFFRTNHNLADFEKNRIKNKTFFRFFTSFLYLILAIFIILFEVFN